MDIKKRRIKLLVFDLDGTLIDSLQDITDALNYSLAPFGYPPMKKEEVKRFVGRGITGLVERILKPEDINLKDKVLKEFLQYYSEHLTDHTKTYPAVEETLNLLTEYKKAVVSNKRESLTKRILEDLNLLRHFKYIIGSDTLPEKKPSPLPIRYLMEKEHLSQDEVVIIGDSEIDILTGKNAGILCIAVGYGYRPLDSLQEADYILKDSLKGLPELLRRIEHERH
jgi:phosphoglycolate phosphatase